MSDPAAPVPAPDPFRPPAALDPFRPPTAVGEAPEVAPLEGDVHLAGGAPSSGAGTDTSATRAVGGVLLGILAIAAAALIAIVAIAPRIAGPAASPSAAPVVLLAADNPAIQPAPAISLTDQRGQAFGLNSLLGRPVLVFFGYTHCPDVCPVTVGTLNEALAKVAPGPRVAFVTIDPERDDVASMAAYPGQDSPQFDFIDEQWILRR